MLDLFITYGDDALKWLLAAAGALLLKYVFSLVKNSYANGVLGRAWLEVQGAVLEVEQVYVGALRAARADGKLTDAEKAQAKAMAIAIARENLGKKGLARLARVLGLDSVERWLGSKSEQALATVKAAVTNHAPAAPARPIRPV